MKGAALLSLLFLLSCAPVMPQHTTMTSDTTWEPKCWQNAVYYAIIVESNGDTARIVEGYRSGTRHAEAQARLSNVWWYLNFNGFYVYPFLELKSFKPDEDATFTLDQYLVRMQQWFKKK